MSEVAQLLERQETGIPFDGVQGAKNTVEPLVVPRILFQSEQIVIEPVQSFARFQESATRRPSSFRGTLA